MALLALLLRVSLAISLDVCAMATGLRRFVLLCTLSILLDCTTKRTMCLLRDKGNKFAISPLLVCNWHLWDVVHKKNIATFIRSYRASNDFCLICNSGEAFGAVNRDGFAFTTARNVLDCSAIEDIDLNAWREWFAEEAFPFPHSISYARKFFS